LMCASSRSTHGMHMVYTRWYTHICLHLLHGMCMVCMVCAWTPLAQRCKHLQVSLVLLFTASQSVYLFRQLQYIYDTDSPFRIIGFRSLDEVVGLMIGFNLIVLLAFVGMVVYQAFTQPAAGNFRLVTNRQPPELTLANKMRYHLFLSHVGHCRSNLATNL
jgi:hypothetical protein